MPDQSDANFKRIVPADLPALEVVEQGSSAISRWVRSPAGTRTLAFVSEAFTPTPAGTTVALAAHRRASALYGIGEATERFIELRFTGKAPWEE